MSDDVHTTVALPGGLSLDYANEARQLRETGDVRGAKWLELVGQECAEAQSALAQKTAACALLEENRDTWRMWAVSDKARAERAEARAEARGQALEFFRTCRPYPIWVFRAERWSCHERTDGYEQSPEVFLGLLAAAIGVDPTLLQDAPEEATPDEDAG